MPQTTLTFPRAPSLRSPAPPARRDDLTPEHAPEPTPRARRTAPAALEWRDQSLPLVGTARAVGWLPTILLAMGAVALVYLVQTSGIATTGYDIQRLQRERTEWQLRNEQLKLELAKRRSLAWVEAEAVTRLGMRRPRTVAHLELEAVGTIGSHPRPLPTGGEGDRAIP